MNLQESNPLDLKLRQLVHADAHNVFGRISNIAEKEDGMIIVTIDWRNGVQTNLPVSQYPEVSFPEDPENLPTYGWY